MNCPITYGVSMTRPLLPPRGIFIPTQMIFLPQLHPAVRLTCLQLFSLAWDGRVTPALSMQDLVKITRKSQSTLYRHMLLLRSIAVVNWYSTQHGTFIISFPDNPTYKPEYHPEISNIPSSRVQNSENTDKFKLSSYFPPRILGYLTYQEGHEESQSL